MKICVVGTGYVGLITGICLADMGNEVTCADIDETKVERLSAGESVIFEPGHQEILERNLAEKRLIFTTDIAGGIKAASIVFIAVGTPEDEDGSADLRHVLEVGSSIGKAITGYKLVVVKSTVPVGTCEKVSKEIKKQLKLRRARVAFDVASNPEFLKEGSAVADFMKPDRIVIGCPSKKAEELLTELYQPFLRTNNPLITMDVRSAEMTKYASNAMLATKISFINEIANICDRVGADVGSVRLGMGADSRIGYQFLFPGLGYGGSCFPKDVKALVHTARLSGYDPVVLSAVDQLNETQKALPARRALTWFRENGIDAEKAAVAVWGIAFKPNTDDIREAPALSVIGTLLAAGASVRAFDPVAIHNAKKVLGESERLSYTEDNYQALEGVDALIICTEWGLFRRPSFEKMLSLMARPLIFDGRNIFEPKKMASLGFEYHSVGRSVAK